MTDESAVIDDGEISTAPYKSGTDYESLKQWVFSVLGESTESFLIFALCEINRPGYLAIAKEFKDMSDKVSKVKFENTCAVKDLVFDIPARFKRQAC